MSRAFRMPLHLTKEQFGEADLEGDESGAPASRCSYPPPTATLELEIDPDLMALLRETAPGSAQPRDTQPEHQRPTSPDSDARASEPHSIEEAVLRLIETRPRLVPKA